MLLLLWKGVTGLFKLQNARNLQQQFLSFGSNKMRDQPFKRYFPNQRSLPKESYKYPTYQHYYEPKQQTISQLASLTRQQPISDELNGNYSPQSKNTGITGSPKKPRTSLKAELDNLKLQVQKIMAKKQSLMKSPIDRKLFDTDRDKNEPKLTEFRVESCKNEEDISDTQSVSSQKILNEPIKRLQLKKSSQNYDHNQYMQLENNLLKTELRNLKNKYNNKKRQLNEKCDALQKKVSFLQSSLAKSEETLAVQILTLKEALKDASYKSESSIVPTSDKLSQSPKKSTDEVSEQQSQSVKQKLKELYDELSVKNKLIYEKESTIERLTHQVNRKNKAIDSFEERVKRFNEQLEQNQSIINLSNERLEQEINRANQLEEQLQQIKKRQNVNEQNMSSLQDIEQKLQLLRNEYQQKLNQGRSQIQELNSTLRKQTDDKILLEEEVKYIKAQNADLQGRLNQLNERLGNEQNNCFELQQRCKQTLQDSERKHQEIVRNIQQEYHNRILMSSPRKGPPSEQHSPSFKKDKSVQEAIFQKQIRKWKIQYKLLKEKYELYLNNDNKHKTQLKEYYRSYREYKQKLEVYTHKMKLLQREMEKYLNILSTKENELIKKEIQFRKVSNEQAIERNKFKHQTIAFNDKIKLLEDKLNDQVLKNEKEVSYRKEIQEKISELASQESLKDVLDRMKKRLAEQDEKLSKNVKELKSKESLNSKLKQELRQVMENLQKKLYEEKYVQIQKIVETYTTKEQQSFKNWREKAQKQYKILEDSNKNLLQQIQTFKNTLTEREAELVFTQSELKTISHSYNIKCIETHEQLQQKENIIQQYIQGIQEANAIRSHIENVMNEEVMRKNEEITVLRAQIISRIHPNESKASYNPSFDELLKSHMETINKLREEVNKKTEELFKVRDNYSTLRSQYENVKSQIEINKLKMLSQKKNLEVNYQIDLQNLKNQIQGEQKKISSFEQKIKLLIQENKKKDSFIQTYIMGKKLPQNEKDLITEFIKQYEITLGSADIIDRLQTDGKEIEKLNLYNFNLLKEISQLKEKMLQYDMIDHEKVSLFESKLSRYSRQSSSILQESIERLQQPKRLSENRLKKTGSMQDFTMLQHEFV